MKSFIFILLVLTLISVDVRAAYEADYFHLNNEYMVQNYAPHRQYRGSHVHPVESHRPRGHHHVVKERLQDVLKEPVKPKTEEKPAEKGTYCFP